MLSHIVTLSLAYLSHSLSVGGGHPICTSTSDEGSIVNTAESLWFHRTRWHFRNMTWEDFLQMHAYWKPNKTIVSFAIIPVLPLPLLKKWEKHERKRPWNTHVGKPLRMWLLWNSQGKHPRSPQLRRRGAQPCRRYSCDTDMPLFCYSSSLKNTILIWNH